MEKVAVNNDIKSYRGFVLSIAWIIYMIAGLLLYTSWAFTPNGDLNTFGLMLKASRYLVYLMCAASFLFYSELKIRNVVLFIISLILTGITFVTSQERTIIFLVLLIITFYGFREEQLLKISFYTTFFVLFLTIVFSKLGIVEDYVREAGDRVRHFLGFSWASYAAIIFFFLILEFLAVKKGKICIREYIVFMAINVWLFLQTNSRFAFVLSVGALTFFLIFGRRMNSIKKDYLYRIFLISPWVIAIGSVAMHWAYNDESRKWERLNLLLSGRLALGKAAIEEYSVHLLGQPIQWVGFSLNEELKNDYNYVDCSYLQILLREGILFLILVLIILTLIIWFAIRAKKYYLVWVMFFMMILCITEPWLLASLAVNPFILCICAMGIKDKPRNNSKIKLRYTPIRFVLK